MSTGARNWLEFAEKRALIIGITSDLKDQNTETQRTEETLYDYVTCMSQEWLVTRILEKASFFSERLNKQM